VVNYSGDHMSILHNPNLHQIDDFSKVKFCVETFTHYNQILQLCYVCPWIFIGDTDQAQLYSVGSEEPNPRKFFRRQIFRKFSVLIFHRFSLLKY
jgi:hypothetical protein